MIHALDAVDGTYRRRYATKQSETLVLYLGKAIVVR